MSKKLLFKIGFYSIFEIKTIKNIKYQIDSGKTIYIPNLRKIIVNPYRDVKEFSTLESAKEYIQKKLKTHRKKKEKKLEKLPKSLYLILIKEEKTNKTFVKVGITSKRFIIRRFSKIYGYNGYTVETILRRIDTPDAEILESKIKDQLNKKRSVKKYRPILESFSGYSECYDINCLNDIIEVFDKLTNTH